MQNTVEQLIEKYRLSTDPYARYTDLVSEIGELGKEINLSTEYRTAGFRPSAGLSEELGDCLFSLLALSVSLEVDAEQALEQALSKYRRRFDESGHTIGAVAPTKACDGSFQVTARREMEAPTYKTIHYGQHK